MWSLFLISFQLLNERPWPRPTLSRRHKPNFSKKKSWLDLGWTLLITNKIALAAIPEKVFWYTRLSITVKFFANVACTLQRRLHQGILFTCTILWGAILSLQFFNTMAMAARSLNLSLGLFTNSKSWEKQGQYFDVSSQRGKHYIVW